MPPNADERIGLARAHVGVGRARSGRRTARIGVLDDGGCRLAELEHDAGSGIEIEQVGVRQLLALQQRVRRDERRILRTAPRADAGSRRSEDRAPCAGRPTGCQESPLAAHTREPGIVCRDRGSASRRSRCRSCAVCANAFRARSKRKLGDGPPGRSSCLEHACDSRQARRRRARRRSSSPPRARDSVRRCRSPRSAARTACRDSAAALTKG